MALFASAQLYHVRYKTKTNSQANKRGSDTGQRYLLITIPVGGGSNKITKQSQGSAYCSSGPIQGSARRWPIVALREKLRGLFVPMRGRPG